MYRRSLIFCYWQLVMCGLWPLPVHLSRPYAVRRSKLRYLYMSYSAAIVGALVITIPYSTPANVLRTDYMRRNMWLQWHFMVNFALRLAALASCYSLVWLRRNALVRLYQDGGQLVQQHEQLIVHIVGRTEIKRLERSLGCMIFRKCLISYLLLVCTITVHWQINFFNDTGESIKILLIKLSWLFPLSLVKIELYAVLAVVLHQFECLQLALIALYKLIRNDDQHGLFVDSNPAIILQQRSEVLEKLALMHSTCWQLTRRIFDAFDVRNALLFLNLFATSINGCYHAVQYEKATIKSSPFSKIMGFLLEVFHFWNIIMLMNIVDRLLNACNNIGKLLREFNDLPLVNSQFEHEMERFAQRVRSDKLVYKICNMVEFSKPSCLRCIVAVLVYVIIQMQFDMKKRH